MSKNKIPKKTSEISNNFAGNRGNMCHTELYMKGDKQLPREPTFQPRRLFVSSPLEDAAGKWVHSWTSYRRRVTFMLNPHYEYLSNTYESIESSLFIYLFIFLLKTRLLHFMKSMVVLKSSTSESCIWYHSCHTFTYTFSRHLSKSTYTAFMVYIWSGHAFPWGSNPWHCYC